MNYTVQWNGKEQFPEATEILEPCYNIPKPQEFVIIPSDKGGELIIRSRRVVESAIVRPLSFNIVPEIVDEHTIRIVLTEPKKFSLELNGTHHDNLLVFVMPKHEVDESRFENIIRFTPGSYEVGSFRITKDHTLVIVEEGAVVNGDITVVDAEDVTICGTGIITKLGYDEGALEFRYLIRMINSRDINIYDVTAANSVKWTIATFNCDNVHIDNVNVLGSRGNNDAFDICNSRNVLVENIFVRTWDDSFCVKGWDPDGNVENIVFRNSTLWNDFARPIEIGVEMRCDYAKHIVFQNIDVIHSMTGYPIMGIHHGDHAIVSDVLIDDIRLEDIHGGQVFDLRITDAYWNKDSSKGGIKDVVIKNIAVVEKQDIIPSHSRIEGYSDTASIENVTLENFSFCGRQATSVEDCQIDIYDYVKNVKYIAHESEEKINRIAAKLDITKPFALAGDGFYYGTATVTLTNEGENDESGEFRFQVSPINTDGYDGDNKKFCLRAGESCSCDFELKLQPGKYAVQIQSDDPSVEYVFKYVSLDAHISSDIKKAFPYRFYNYYGEEIEGFRMAATDNELILSSPVNVPVTVYAALPVETESKQVLFSVEETDFGIAPAINNSPGGPIPAPQLRCPAEIQYVFNNKPKVKEIVVHRTETNNGIIKIPFEKLHIPAGTKNFWLDIALETNESFERRYPFTLFHSVRPHLLAHMFGNIIVD